MASTFQQRTLELLKIPAHKWLRCRKARVLQFDRLIVPAMPGPAGLASPWACEFLRSRLLPFAKSIPMGSAFSFRAEGRAAVCWSTSLKLRNCSTVLGFEPSARTR
jgi:hypothetical protein